MCQQVGTRQGRRERAPGAGRPTRQACQPGGCLPCWPACCAPPPRPAAELSAHGPKIATLRSRVPPARPGHRSCDSPHGPRAPPTASTLQAARRAGRRVSDCMNAWATKCPPVGPFVPMPHMPAVPCDCSHGPSHNGRPSRCVRVRGPHPSPLSYLGRYGLVA